jgi:membrane-associated protein
MIPGIELVDFIKWAGLFGIIAVIFAESGLLVGFFLPGDTLLFTAGYLAYAGLLPVNIHILVLCVFAAAVLGDTVGYTFGYRIGRRLYQRKESRLFKKSHLEAAEKFYEKYGGKTIIFARFLPAVRTFAPIVAGASNMSYRKFLAYNVIGAFLWAVLITYLGYYLGRWFHGMGLEIDQVLLPSLAVILVIGWTPAFVHLAQNPDQRKALWRMAKRQLKQLYGINDQDNKSRK